MMQETDAAENSTMVACLTGSPYPVRISHPPVTVVQRNAGLEDLVACKQEVSTCPS